MGKVGGIRGMTGFMLGGGWVERGGGGKQLVGKVKGMGR